MAVPAFNDLNKQQQLAILIGVPVILALLLIYLNHKVLVRLGADPVLPAFLHKEGGKWAEIRQKDSEIEIQKGIIAEGPEVLAKLAALQAEIKQAEERLPRETEKSEMRQLIERLMREIPTEIGTVQYKAVRITENIKDNTRQGGKSEDYQTVVYQTELDGDMNGIIKYIDMIEKNPRFMTIKALNIKPGTVSVDEPNQRIAYGLHSVSMDIVTYVYNPAPKSRGAP